MRKQINLTIDLTTSESIKKGEKEKIKLENNGYELEDSFTTPVHAFFQYVK